MRIINLFPDFCWPNLRVTLYLGRLKSTVRQFVLCIFHVNENTIYNNNNITENKSSVTIIIFKPKIKVFQCCTT